MQRTEAPQEAELRRPAQDFRYRIDGRSLAVHSHHSNSITSAEKNGTRASTTAAEDFQDLYRLPVLMVEEQGVDSERETM